MSEGQHIPLEDSKGGKLSEDKLMAYLEGRLSPEEQHEVEKWLADEGLESDALEGLVSVKAEHTRQSIDTLNHGLRKTLHGKKHKRGYIKNDMLVWLAVGIILMLAILAYIVIRMIK